jgi:hypothetical protein
MAAAQDINLRLDKIIKLLDSIVLPKGTKPQGTAASLRITDINPIIGKVNALTSETSKKSETPREVLQRDTSVIVNEYSSNVKKFWNDLFKKYFVKEEVKKEPEKKKSSFLETLLTLLGVALFVVYELFANKIIPFIKKIWNAIEDLWLLFKDGTILKWLKNIKNTLQEAWLAIKESNLGKFFEKIGRAIREFFRRLKLGVIKSLRKSKVGRFILRTIRAINRTFSNIGKSVMRVLQKIKVSKIGIIVGKIFRGIGRVFRILGSGISRGIKIGARIIKPILRVLRFIGRAFGFIGKILCKLLPGIKVFGKIAGRLFLPLAILLAAFDIFSGIFTTVQKEGLSFTSTLKGFAVGLIRLFTLGFVDSDKILNKFNEAIEKLGNFFSWLYECITNIPIHAKNLLRKLPGMKALLGEAETTAEGQYSAATKALTQEEILKNREKVDKRMGRVSPEKQQAQDFISRPGQPVVNFSDKDTLIGAKSGGPLEKAMFSSMELNKKFTQMTGAAYTKQEELLTQSVELLEQILSALGINKDNRATVIVNNTTRRNNFTMGAIAAPTEYRSGVSS